MLSADSLQHRKGDVPKGNDKSEASKSMPDSLPLTAVFSNSENTFMHLMDANRCKFLLKLFCIKSLFNLPDDVISVYQDNKGGCRGNVPLQ